MYSLKSKTKRLFLMLVKHPMQILNVILRVVLLGEFFEIFKLFTNIWNFENSKIFVRSVFLVHLVL